MIADKDLSANKDLSRERTILGSALSSPNGLNLNVRRMYTRGQENIKGKIVLFKMTDDTVLLIVVPEMGQTITLKTTTPESLGNFKKWLSEVDHRLFRERTHQAEIGEEVNFHLY